jgi:hypothetical protein
MRVCMRGKLRPTPALKVLEPVQASIASRMNFEQMGCHRAILSQRQAASNGSNGPAFSAIDTVVTRSCVCSLTEWPAKVTLAGMAL